ncbi:MAG: ParB N-terminal domain-containing protein, partial [Phycisphaerales bacterium]
MKIEMKAALDLVHYPDNPRDNDAAVAAVAESIERFGFRQPIVVDKDSVVVVGHTRLKAALKLGIKWVPVHVADLTEEQARAYRLADNRTGAIATWDAGLLQSELEALQQLGLDIESLASLGFDDRELAALGNPGNAGETDPDEVPEPPDDPITQPGDLWILGNHRLLCGDSTTADDVGWLMDGINAAAVMTDPPYGVDYVGKTKDALVVHNDGAEGLPQLLKHSLGNANDVCLAGGAWYVAAPAGPQFADFATVLGALGIWRQTIVWVKDSMVLGRSDYHYRHEAIFYGWKPGAAHKELPDRKQTTVWEIPRPKASREHPTMKPVALYERMMANSSSVGSLI